MSESLSVLPQQDMRRYFEKPEDQLSVIMEADPVCLYLETTNRCNLLCTTCPRTFETLEPEKDMSWELFTSIIDQYPKIARVVLHGIGEPMLVKDLPRMIRYLKDRGVYVLFNTNGTLLTKANGQALIDAGWTNCGSRSMPRNRLSSRWCGAKTCSTASSPTLAISSPCSALPITGCRGFRFGLPACARPWRNSKPSFAWHIGWG